MTAQIINSFTYNLSGGNPAGVVIDMDNLLNQTEMQTIAKRLALSETAFISSGDENVDFNLRFFTPNNEVDLCGHATIASFWYLAHTKIVQKLKTSQMTKAGRLAVELLPQSDGSILTYMEQMAPKRIASTANLKEMLTHTLSNTSVSNSLPTEIWSTGLKDIILPINSREALNTLIFDYDKLTAISETLDVVGVHAFAIEGDEIFARNFAPRFGIDEESATGTSNGALTAYLQRYLYPDKKELALRIIQGEFMGKTSAIYTKWQHHGNHESIWVGGNCTLIDEIIL